MSAMKKTKEKLKGFVEEEGNTLAEWLEWWDQRKGFLFRAFAPFGPRMNQVESVHEYKDLRAGTSTARGWGPCSTERQWTTHFREIEAARKLGEEMLGHKSHRNGRKIDSNSSHRPPTTKRKSKKKVEKKQNKKPKLQSKAANEH